MDLSKIQEHITEPIAPKYRYFWVPATQNNSMVAAFVGGGAGDPIIGEVTSLGGLRIQVATDDHAFLIAFPDDLDIEKAVGVRVVWSSDQTTTADSYTWTLKYTELTLDTTALTAGATALDTAIAADTNIGTANAIQATAWGEIAASTLTGTSSDGYLHQFLLDPAAVGGTPLTDLVVIWGFQFRYFPKKL